MKCRIPLFAPGPRRNALFMLFLYSPMKRFLIISYWVVSILLVAVVLTSIGYRFLEALFIGSMFLPGALAAKYFFPKVRGVKDTVFLVLGILMAEILLFLIAHYLILTYRENLPLPMWDWPDLPQILTNPVFIALILTTLAAGSYFFESWLDRKRPTRPAPITFTSDRKPVTVDGVEVPFTKTEYEILKFFLENRGKVFSREQLLSAVWPDDVIVLPRTVDVNITRIRKKIGPYGEALVAKAGFGYSFQE